MTKVGDALDDAYLADRNCFELLIPILHTSFVCLILLHTSKRRKSLNGCCFVRIFFSTSRFAYIFYHIVAFFILRRAFLLMGSNGSLLTPLLEYYFLICL